MPLRFRLLPALVLVLAAGMFSGCKEGMLEKLGGRLVKTGVRKAQQSVKRTFKDFSKRSDHEMPLHALTLRDEVEVIGWEPYWLLEGTETYEPAYDDHLYNLLSTLVVGYYDINPATGGVRDDSTYRLLRNSPVYQARTRLPIANENLKILIALSYGEDLSTAGYASLLDTKGKSFKNLVKNLCVLVSDSNVMADGIVVDFRSLPKGQGKRLAGFLAELHSYLDTAGGATVRDIYLCLPAQGLGTPYSGKEFFDELALAPQPTVRKFIINTWDHPYSVEAPYLSQVASAKGTRSGLDSTLAYYKRQMAETFPNPAAWLIPEFAYMGLRYVAANDTNPLLGERIRRLPLDSVMARAVADREEDDNACAEGRCKTNINGASFNAFPYTYYFENDSSLALKYRWLASQGIKGVSLYGLGYNTRDVYSKAQNEKARKVVKGSLWQVLAGQYAAVPARTTYPTIAFLLMFILAGLLMGVVIHPEVRNEIARKGAHRWSFRIVTILLVIGIFASLILTIPGQVAAGTGGLLAVFPFLRRFRSMIKR